MKPPRVAIITPYYKETRSLLERAIDSVRSQSVGADHILIADGFPQDWIESASVRHIRLDRSHQDFGNTPRGLGALLAASEGYDVIGFLDADNWYEKNHIHACLAAAEETFGGRDNCDCVIAKRSFRRPDESVLPIDELPGHTDTNCFVFLPGSFHLLSIWVTMPKVWSHHGDRVFNRALRSSGLKLAFTDTRTVNYFTNWASDYRRAGEPPPPGAKQDTTRPAPVQWSPRDLQIAARLSGGVVYNERRAPGRSVKPGAAKAASE